MLRFAANSALAARSVRAAILRHLETGGEGDGRERGDAQNDFRHAFHGNSPN
jgi:hypothetical protein